MWFLRIPATLCFLSNSVAREPIHLIRYLFYIMYNLKFEAMLVEREIYVSLFSLAPPPPSAFHYSTTILLNPAARWQ